MRTLLHSAAIVAALSISSIAPAATPPTPSQETTGSPRTGIEAMPASTRQPGGYNNYCQTWRAYRAKDRALFGACLADD